MIGKYINVIILSSVIIQIKLFFWGVFCVVFLKGVVFELFNMMYVVVVFLEREMVKIYKIYINKYFK